MAAVAKVVEETEEARAAVEKEAVELVAVQVGAMAAVEKGEVKEETLMVAVTAGVAMEAAVAEATKPSGALPRRPRHAASGSEGARGALVGAR